MLRKYQLSINDTTVNVDVDGPKEGILTITIGEATFPVNITDGDHKNGVYKITVGDTKHIITLTPNPKTSDYTLQVQKEIYVATLKNLDDISSRRIQPTTLITTPATITATSPQLTTGTKTAEPGTVTAPLPGRVLEVRVKEGDTIKGGDVLLVLEAMKMANEIRAPQSGTVGSVHVEAGTTVEKGQPMVSIK